MWVSQFTEQIGEDQDFEQCHIIFQTFPERLLFSVSPYTNTVVYSGFFRGRGVHLHLLR